MSLFATVPPLLEIIPRRRVSWIRGLEVELWFNKKSVKVAFFWSAFVLMMVGAAFGVISPFGLESPSAFVRVLGALLGASASFGVSLLVYLPIAFSIKLFRVIRGNMRNKKAKAAAYAMLKMGRFHPDWFKRDFERVVSDLVQASYGDKEASQLLNDLYQLERELVNTADGEVRL